MSNVAKIDLRRLTRAMDGRSVNFMLDADGDVMDDSKAREKLAAYIAEGFSVIPMRRDDSAAGKEDRDTSRLARLKDRLTELRAQRARCIASWRPVPPTLQMKIADCEHDIAECESRIPRSMNKLLPRDSMERSGIIRKMIRMHIAADYLTECAMEVRETLEGLGLETCNLFPLVDQIERRASRFAGIVCHPEFDGLSEMMTTDGRLIDDIHALVGIYMKEKLA